MTERARGGCTASMNDWDPMTDDFNDSSQYPDDNSEPRLDHSKLYITGIPSGLAKDGFLDLFGKFGRIVSSFLSRDPLRRFALVAYETPGEARVAMMKLNRTEPLKLVIHFARAKGSAQDQSTHTNKQSRTDRPRDGHTERNCRNTREDMSSVSSRGRSRMIEDPINGDIMDEDIDGSNDMNFNTNLHYNLETLKLKQLELKEKQLECQQRILIMQQAEKNSARNTSASASKRRILPNGRIVVQNGADMSQDDPAGAGDSRGARCVSCGVKAEDFCAQCCITPYCGTRCQQRDWTDRHSAVCHNLARWTAINAPEEGVSATVDAKPSTEIPRVQKPLNNSTSDQQATNKKYMPPGQSVAAYQAMATNTLNEAQGTRNARPQANTSRCHNAELDKSQGGGRNVKDCGRGIQNGSRNKQDGGTYQQDGGSYQQNGGRNKQDGVRDRQESGKSAGKDAKRNISDNCLAQKPSVDEKEIVQRQPLRRPDMTPKTANPGQKPAQTEPAPRTEGVKSELNCKESLRDVTPRKPLVPNSYMVEKLSIGASFLATVEATTGDCASRQKGYVCLALHEDFGDMYGQLCDDFSVKCEADTKVYTPRIGETVAYFCEEDGGWYRARCLAPTRVALLDSPRVLSLSNKHCRQLPTEYKDIPEFTAVINTAKLEIGMSLRCVISDKAPLGYKVNMEDSDTGVIVGQGEVMRFVPLVEYPVQDTVSTQVSSQLPQATSQLPQVTSQLPQVTSQLPQVTSQLPQATSQLPQLPQIPRPPVHHNSTVVLLDVTSLERACVRSCDVKSVTEFDAAHHDTMLYGMDAKPIQEPPVKGQLVIAKYSDGAHYRAIVKRTNVAKNKYLIEYVEFGNEETAPIERLYPCPDNLQLSVKPAQSSIIKLSDRQPSKLTPAANVYIDNLKDNLVELMLVIPGGNKTADSGSTCILLATTNSEPVSRKIEELCTPEWRRLLERGATVLETPSRMFSDLQYLPLPTSRPFSLAITFCDLNTLANGVLNGYELGTTSANFVYGDLTDQIQEYCASALCKESYLPKLEELCITKLDRVNKWVRAVLVALPDGPGSSAARVCAIDYGDVIDVPVSDIRKMMPEFIDQYPALANHIEIKDFPANITECQLERGLRHLKLTSTGTGTLQVDRCRKLEDEIYELEANELIGSLAQ